MFWETLPGLIASWSAAIAGLIYLISKIGRAWSFTRRLAAGVARLIELGTTDAWPNGSNTLPESITEIYKRQGTTHELIEAYIVTHRQDHELLEGNQ